jgi:hypothetical protein
MQTLRAPDRAASQLARAVGAEAVQRTTVAIVDLRFVDSAEGMSVQLGQGV